MNSIIVYPHTEAQEKAVKAVLDALEIYFENFEMANKEILPQHVIDAIKISEEQLKNGEYHTHDEVMQKYKKYS